MVAQDGAKALIMAIHADLGKDEAKPANWPRDSIHVSWIEAFLEAADSFGKPVLLIHGDSCTFLIDHPLVNQSNDDSPLITRLQAG